MMDSVPKTIRETHFHEKIIETKAKEFQIATQIHGKL